MNRKKALVSFVIFAMLLCGSLVFPVRAISSDWSKPRPLDDMTYNETFGKSYTDGIGSVEMGVTVGKYSENDAAYSYQDHLSLKVSASANTRMAIQYDCFEQDWKYKWHSVSEPTYINGDNSGTWLECSLLYYGVEYNKIWVSSNGFLTLNKTSTNPNPQDIPSTDEPNPVIAAFWRDLHPEKGGSITYGRDVEFNYGYYFVVSWNNVPDDSDTPQTFQILIEHRQGFGSEDFHNKIFFQYKSITKSYPTTVGTETQVGNKGTAYDYNNLHDEACLSFDNSEIGYRLERLKIKLTKNDVYAKINFLRTETGGYNVELKEHTNPYGDDFKYAIKSAASLALLKAGIMWKIMLIIADGAGILSNDLSPPFTDADHVKDAWEGDSEAYVWAHCRVENRSMLNPFDSTLASTIEWVFKDSNNRDHYLTITTELTYLDLNTMQLCGPISTSATLYMYVGKKLSISCETGGTTDPAPGTYEYEYGTSVTAKATAYNYFRFEYWTLNGWWYTSSRTATVVMDRDHTLRAHFKYIGGGGDQCPTLFVWDGSDYNDFGVIDIHADEDVVREVSVPSESVGVSNYKALFRLREGWEGLTYSHSIIDQVKLYALDGEGNRQLCPLINATHSELGNVLPQLLLSDDWKCDIHLLETIDLNFVVPSQTEEIQGFIFVIEGCNMYKK